LFGIYSKFLIFTIENLTDQLQKEREKYKHLAEYDHLTGLYTRNFFNE
jgi:GGDEF domain-containing protein